MFRDGTKLMGLREKNFKAAKVSRLKEMCK